MAGELRYLYFRLKWRERLVYDNEWGIQVPRGVVYAVMFRGFIEKYGLKDNCRLTYPYQRAP